jgi:hypothetical protein
MTFERTHSLSLVRSILTKSGVWPYIGDDFAPNPESFRPNDDHRIWYVLADEVYGLFMFVPESPVCWQVHVAMLRGQKPEVTHQAGREIVPWVWENTGCRRIYASVPTSNRAAIRFGLRAMGLEIYGRNPASFMKHGQLWDQVLMGVSRPFTQGEI